MRGFWITPLGILQRVQSRAESAPVVGCRPAVASAWLLGGTSRRLLRCTTSLFFHSVQLWRLSKVPIVRRPDPEHYEFWFDNFWDVIQTGFLLDLHGSSFEHGLQLWMDAGEVARCLNILDGPLEGLDLEPFLDCIGSLGEDRLLVNNNFIEI